MSKIEKTLRFIAIDAVSASAPLRICVAIPTTGASEPLVLLASGVGLRIYLGALVDSRENPVEWLQIMVQTVGGLGDSPATWRDRLTNARLDADWSIAAREFAKSLPDASRATGWEQTPPQPTWLDLNSGKPWHPVESGSGHQLRLCTDDNILSLSGVPAYSSSLHRYAVGVDQHGNPVEPVFYPLTPNAPTSASTRDLQSMMPSDRNLIPFNREGGLMEVRRLAPISLTGYLELLGGRPWQGLIATGGWMKILEPYADLMNWDKLLQQPDHFFLGGRGQRAILLEGVHLRLQLVLQMVLQVARTVEKRQLPMLNLSTDSFRVELGPVAPALPVLWTARTRLEIPAGSIALPLEGGNMRFFLPLAAPSTTIYRPEYLGLPVRGRARVRLRRISTDKDGATCVEGTMVTPELLQLTANDVVWLKLPLSGVLMDLYAHVDTNEALAAGESRFRTVPLKITPTLAEALQQAEGNVFDGTTYETVPLLSTPCDLYALGVLAVQALLVNRQNTLGIALDEIQSMARQLGNAPGAGDEYIGDRIAALAAEDSRWLSSLGPQRLWHENISPEQALAAVPEALWWRVVGTIAKFFPDHGADAYCKNFGDFSPFALEQVFSRPVEELTNLVAESRGLLFCDWIANQEVTEVLAKMNKQ